MLGRALGLDPAALRDLAVWSHLDAGAGFAVRTDDVDEGSWDLVLPSDAADTVIPVLESAGIVPASRELAEALRIDAGHPLFGVDMTSDSIPLEAGLLDRAISQSKGCYVGQEVIIRILHRGAGRVAIRLVQMMCDAMDAPVPMTGAKISVDGSEVGLVTSAAWSPRSRGVIALGYLARAQSEPGRALSIEGSGAATIRKLAS
jgi:folate-binding protein YgfZ